MKRLATTLLVLLGVGLLAAGAVLLWLDARLGAAQEQSAEVVLAGPRVTDLDLPVEGTDRIRHLQALTVDAPAAIGSSVDVQVIDSPVTLARLADDDRWLWGGVGLAAAGLLLLLLVTVISVRGRRRRRAGKSDSGTSAPAATATALITLLLISGCSWTGDDVDRDAYRAARTALVAALPGPQADAVAPVFGTPLSEPVTDPESAVPIVLAAAGLPVDATTTTAARFVTRQLFDPAMLCEGAPVDPVLELMVPDLAAQAAPVESLVVRIDDCGGLSFDDMRVGAASGSVSPTPSGGWPGTTVTLTVSAVYRNADAGDAPYAIERQVTVNTSTSQPDRIVSVGWEAADAGPGLATTVLPEPGAFPAWDEELLAAPRRQDPNSAAAVIQALAATLAEDAVVLGLEDEWVASDDESQEISGAGHLVPATGEAQLAFEGDDLRGIRVLGHERTFVDEVADDGGENWWLYATARQPQLYESSQTWNPFAVLDWLRHLSRAAPVDCPESVEAQACHAVEVPTDAALTPGTPGYREATAHARRGNPTMTMVVGVTDGRLAAVTMGREYAFLARSVRHTSTWSFGSWEEDVPVPAVERPAAWTDVDAP